MRRIIQRSFKKLLIRSEQKDFQQDTLVFCKHHKLRMDGWQSSRGRHGKSRYSIESHFGEINKKCSYSCQKTLDHINSKCMGCQVVKFHKRLHNSIKINFHMKNLIYKWYQVIRNRSIEILSL